MKDGNRFGDYILNLRTEKNVSQMQLCDGLCDISTLSRIERREKVPDKLLQNRFLTRLGMVPENYENFLYYKDYRRWEQRQGILHYILEEDIELAKKLLEEYRQEYSMEEPLEQQFYLAMLAQIKRYEGSSEEELAELFGQALLLTVPQIEERGFATRVLSLEEINLLLEYVHCSVLGQVLQSYDEILSYIEKVDRTPLAMAKIYPKTVYYFYLAWEKRKEKSEFGVRRMQELCNKAIELLRNANRMFYLWELLCMKEALAEYLTEEERTEEKMAADLKQCRDWRETLEEIYRDYGVSIGMYEFCYLYVESENYCIGDVIRIRRKMLGMSITELSEGICSARTISRLERNETEPQWEIVKLLMERLNLAAEFCRTELITDSQEAIEMCERLKIHISNRNCKQVSLLLEELKKLVSMEIPSNRQALMRKEVINQMNDGVLTRTEYVSLMKKALECTVPYKVIVASGEKYLTNEEMTCIQNLTLEIDWSFREMKECVSVLEEICESPKFPVNYLRMYQFIMSSVACYFGDRGEYNRSDKINMKIIKLLLRGRKIGGIYEALYEMLWNEEQRGEEREASKMNAVSKRELEKCIHLSCLCGDTYRMRVYQEKLGCQE